MKYQDYKLKVYETRKEDYVNIKERLLFMPETLAEEGYSAFEEIEDLKFEKYYDMKFD